ncbi:MAG: isovaleryl-CoA dehydrogenase [Candidatus Rokubacteria bacterium]|nr:isovaleryl-CoA dehydrogenase [Candidatus Rokubacteria bacterium]
MATHEVANQPPPLVDWNLLTTDRALVEALHREGAGWAEGELAALGGRLGEAEVLDWGTQANRYPPVLHAFDRFGRRRDEVEFHPAWHALLGLAVEAGLHSGPWRTPRPGAHVARAAGLLLLNQVEAGVCCPLAMTYAAVPALRRQADVAAEWVPRICTTRYDPRSRPAGEKAGVLVGMAMTEKQGGSDVRANTTRAVPVAGGGPGGEYRLTGHKWFCSAPMSDAFLVLAQAPGGLSCFLLPRCLPDGAQNRVALQRLKDKLGNRSNASGEIELDGAWARLVGEEGRGVPTIIEMATYTRLDCALGAAGLMRQAVAQAAHHAAHRLAFGRRLVDQPLMRSVLADLAVESEAATALAMRLGRAFDAQDDPRETAFRRIATPAAKYWLCKRAPAVVVEAMEVLGGNGYVEECVMPRLYREAPLNSIWEGSGNVMCLDVLRALGRQPETLEAVRAELRLAAGGDPRLDAFTGALQAELAAGVGGVEETEALARRLTERLALALQGALLVRHGPGPVAEAFCAARLAAGGGQTFGTPPATLPKSAVAEILERARPSASPSASP